MADDRLPGLVDPPASLEDSLTFQQWTSQVTEIIRLVTAQQGVTGNAFVSYDDMVASGLFFPVAAGITNNSTAIGEGNYTSPVADTDMTPPGKVTSVVVSSLVGAIEIEWLPPAMSFPYYFEVWRSATDSQDDRALIGTSSAFRYSDINVEDNQTYTYWIRVVKTVSNTVVYGSYDSVAGTQGSPKSTAANILDVVSEDMYIATPGGNKNPFTYQNIGTEENPNWVIALRADVAVQGSLAIGQLESGELPESVTFSVGQGSITLDTRSDGSGQMLIAGQGGITGNDYLIMNQGRIASYVWNGTEHVQYKEVRRIERGVAPAGHEVNVPAYFKAQPTIYLAPFIIPTYNPDYPTQGQQWRLSHSNVEPNPNEAGGWLFTPKAQLELTDGNSTLVYSDRTYNGSSNSYSTEISNRTSLKSLRVNARFKSIRSTGASGQWYNRRVTIQVWYRPINTTTWLAGPTNTVSANGLNDTFATIDFSLPSVSDYDIKISYAAADAGGSFTTGIQYEQTTRTVGGGTLRLLYGDVTSTRSSGSIYVDAPSLGGGWSVIRSQWSYNYAIDAQRSSGNRWYGWMERPGTSGYSFSSGTGIPVSGSFTSVYNGYDRRCSFSVGLDYKASYNWIILDITNVSVLFTYQRPVPVSTTPSNNFYLDSIEYDQGAQVINPTNETILINWLAVGE